jgi:uncharacterized protein (DUF2141 family)
MQQLIRTKKSGIALLSLLLCLPFSSMAADLTVQVMGQSKGTIYIALYDREEAWKTVRDPRQVSRDSYADNFTKTFKDLPPGRYAIRLFVDENDNGKLDRNPLGIPVEPYGFSRDATGMMGPPTFDDAAIDMAGDATLAIHLR